MQNKKLIQTTLDEIVELAWIDDVSFDDIEKLTGLNERAVKDLMHQHLKPSSYRCWRKRVKGRATKHAKKLKRVPIKLKQPY